MNYSRCVVNVLPDNRCPARKFAGQDYALAFAFHHFDLHHADPQLTRGVAEDVPSLVVCGSGRVMISVLLRVGLSKCSVVVVTSLSRVSACSLSPTRTGIGLLAFGP